MKCCCIVWCEKYFDTLNHLGVDHDCQTDGQTDGQMYRHIDRKCHA